MRIFSSVCYRQFLVLGAFCLALLLVLIPVHARAQAGQTINVANGDVAELITAIQTLNANGGGTIDLAEGGTYSVTAPSDWWYGPNAFPAIASPITINGNGATISRAAGSPKFRFFYVSGGFSTLPAGSLNLSELTLTGGLAQGGNGGAGSPGGGGGAGFGGAIYNQGTVSLADVTFSSNQAHGGSGGSTSTLGNAAGGGGLGGSGGSTIYNNTENGAPGPAGGGGFEASGQNSQNFTTGNGGGFLGSEGGTQGLGGTSAYGGNGANQSSIAGGGGGGFEPGENGATGSSDEGGAGGVGGGNGGDAVTDGLLGGGGGAFGGGGSGGSTSGGGGGGGGVGGGGGGGDSGGNGGFGGGQGGNTYSVAGYNIGSQGSGGFGGGGGGQNNGGDASSPAAGTGGFGGGNGLLAQGNAGGNGGGGGGMGGAIFNHKGVLEVLQSEFTSNSAVGGGGGGTSDGFGGAIFNLDGNVLLNGVTYSGNTATKSSGSADSGPFAYNLSHNAGNVASGQTASAVFNLISTPLGETSDAFNNQVNGTATLSVNPSIAAAVVSPGALGFGSLFVDETVPSQIVTLSNPGNTALTLSSVAISGTGFSIAGNTCGTSLAGRASCQVTVALSTASAGSLTGSLTFTDNSYYATTQSVTLSATVAAQTPATQLVFSVPPSPSVWAGGTAGPVTVIEATAGGVQQYTSTGNITLAVSGPNGYSQSYSTNAIAGAAVFDLAGVQLTATGTYTYTATGGGFAEISAAETVATATVSQAAANGTITVPIASGGTIASIEVLTGGAPNLDYTMDSGGSCSVGTAVIAGQSCTVNVAFTPVSAGQRSGAAVIYSATGAVLGTGYISANAQGPQITYSSMSSEGIGSGWTSPYSIAVDAAANVYAADSNKVFKVTYADASYGSPMVIATTGDLTAVTVDGAGNVFYSDGVTGVFELPWIGTSYGSAVSISSGIGAWGAPYGLAVDGAGNLFVLDNANDQVVELPRTATGYGAGVAIGQDDFINPVSLAVDGADNIYVADSGYADISGYAAVYQLPSAGGWSNLNTIGGGYSNDLKNVAVDATGDLYVSDEGAGTVVRFPWTGTGLGNPATMLSGQWNAVAVDNLGNLYGAAYTPQVTKFTVTNPPSFNFATATTVDTLDTTDGPQTVSLYNIGNQPLVFTVPVTGSNPSYPASFPANSADGSLCTSATPVAEGASCDVSVNFAPTGGGANTGSVVLTDNALNATKATQSIALSGTGVGLGTQTITFTPPVSPVTYGVSPITLLATGGDSGNPVTFSIVSGPGTLSGTNNSLLTVTGVGTIVIAANQAGNTGYAAAAQVTQSIVVQTPPLAELVSPGPGSTLPAPTVTFSWSALSGVNGYFLHLGTTGAGSLNLLNSAEYSSSTTSVTINSLPANGETIYARLFTDYNGTHFYQDYVFIACKQAALTLPGTSGTLAGPTVTFGWSAGTGNVYGYFLHLGTTGVGSDNLLNSAEYSPYTASVAVNNLPVNGETIYARLFTDYNGTHLYQDYVFTASSQAALTLPGASGTLAGPAVTFGWSAATGSINGYFLHLGTTGVGSLNLLNSAEYPASTTSVAVNNLPVNGETIYARLFTDYNGAHLYQDYVFTASSQAALTLPGASGTLAGPTVTFGWSAATGSINGYFLHLGSTGVGSDNLLNSAEYPKSTTSVAISGLPVNGETIYARVFTDYNGTHLFKDYTFTAAKQALLTSPLQGATLYGATATFDWSAATGSVNGYFLHLGTTGVGSMNLLNSAEYPTSTTSVTVNNLPASGETIYARVFTDYNGTHAYQDYTFTSVPVPVTLSATSLSFGTVSVGATSASQSVTMTNTGTAVLTISSIALTGANASQFVFANTCGTSLAAGASCTIHGHFAPTATGAITAAVTIADSAAGSPQSIALTGSGQ